MEVPPRTIVVAGYARMPEGTAVRAMYEILQLGVVVDASTHVVLEATSTLATDVGRAWVRRLLTGQHLLQEPANFVLVVRRDYWGQAQKALCHCYQDIVQRYRDGLAAESVSP